MRHIVLLIVARTCGFTACLRWSLMVGGKPLGFAMAWINRRSVDLHPTVPRPDFIFSDIASPIPLLDGKAICDDRLMPRAVDPKSVSDLMLTLRGRSLHETPPGPFHIE